MQQRLIPLKIVREREDYMKIRLKNEINLKFAINGKTIRELADYFENEDIEKVKQYMKEFGSEYYRKHKNQCIQSANKWHKNNPDKVFKIQKKIQTK